MKDRDVLDVRGTAEYLGFNTWTVYRYWKAGKIPGQKIGSRIRFSKKALERYLSKFEKPGGVRET